MICSGQSTMNPSWNHLKGIASPWWSIINLKKRIQIGCMASVLPVPEFLFQIPGFYQIIQRSLYSATGHPQFSGYGWNCWPALSSFVCPVMQIHIYCYSSMRKFRSINLFKVSHLRLLNPSVMAACIQVFDVVEVLLIAYAYSSLAPVRFHQLQAALMNLPSHQMTNCLQTAC